MDCLNAVRVLTFLAFVQVINGQTATLTGSSTVQQGTDTVFRCNVNGGIATQFLWIDNSVTPSQTIYSGGNRFSGNSKYTNFQLTSETDTASVMTIENTAVEDEGTYLCSIPSNQDGNSNTLDVMVEVAHSFSFNVTDPLVNGSMYNATCEALNGRPDVNITWMIGSDDSPCDSIDEPPLTAPADLFSKSSVCTFQADSANNGETLRCIIMGHQVPDLNGEETAILNIHSAPASTGIMRVEFKVQNQDLTVTCNIYGDQPNPAITNYYIYRNDTLIPQSTTEDNSVDVAEPNFATNFHCVAGNYLGNTTSPVEMYDPTRTTTPSPPTDAVTPPMSGDGKNNTKGGLSEPAGLGPGAIVGIALGSIGLIAIAGGGGVYYAKKKGNGPSGASSTKKHGSSTVGTSNGSEKNDVAAPLNSVNEVVTEDKIKPVAAPRDQGSIQHTTDNPGQAEYAMVDRKKPGGGDMPDTRGPGQKEPPQGMLYADLDLSASAGHTEKKVPQNKDDVVVYSSILV